VAHARRLGTPSIIAWGNWTAATERLIDAVGVTCTGAVERKGVRQIIIRRKLLLIGVYWAASREITGNRKIALFASRCQRRWLLTQNWKRIVSRFIDFSFSRSLLPKLFLHFWNRIITKTQGQIGHRDAGTSSGVPLQNQEKYTTDGKREFKTDLPSKSDLLRKKLS